MKMVFFAYGLALLIGLIFCIVDKFYLRHKARIYRKFRKRYDIDDAIEKRKKKVIKTTEEKIHTLDRYKKEG